MMNWAYDLSRRAFALLLALSLVLVSPALAFAAEDAAEVAGPQGIELLLLLLGAASILGVGFFLSSREDNS